MHNTSMPNISRNMRGHFTWALHKNVTLAQNPQVWYCIHLLLKTQMNGPTKCCTELVTTNKASCTISIKQMQVAGKYQFQAITKESKATVTSSYVQLHKNKESSKNTKYAHIPRTVLDCSLTSTVKQPNKLRWKKKKELYLRPLLIDPRGPRCASGKPLFRINIISKFIEGPQTSTKQQSLLNPAAPRQWKKKKAARRKQELEIETRRPESANWKSSRKEREEMKAKTDWEAREESTF